MIQNSLRFGVFLVPLAFCYAEGATASPLTVCYSVAAPCTVSLIRAGGEIVDVVRDTGPSMVTAGSDYVASNFGDNSMVLRGSGAQGLADSVDRFVIEGGGGSGLMHVTWRLDGTAQTSTYEISAAYGGSLTSPMVFVLSSFNRVPCCDVRLVDRSGTFAVPFEYGVPFAFALRLIGTIGDGGGLVSFPGSFRITKLGVPVGASFDAASDTVYPVSSVPEPMTVLVVGAGVIGLGTQRWSRRRRRSQAAWSGRSPVGVAEALSKRWPIV